MTIAKVDGVAVGGGLELTLVCDFVVATDRSRWGMPEIDWEITPGWGGTNRLAWFAGRRKAKEWNLTGNLFDAATAERHNPDQPPDHPGKTRRRSPRPHRRTARKNPRTRERTKKCVNYGADNVAFGLALESEWIGRGKTQGIADFPDPQRRKLSKTFWQD